MRVIQITDDDAKALLEKLELRARQTDPSMVLGGGNPERKTAGDVHRMFHHEVVRWLQGHGAVIP